MTHGDAREGNWRGNWRMKWVASTLHTISEHGVSNITTADAHTSTASSQLNWRPRQRKWTPPFRGKTKSGFCACVITFQTHSTTVERFKRRMYFLSRNSIISPYASSGLTIRCISASLVWNFLLRPCPLCAPTRSSQGAWDTVTSPARPVDEKTNSAVRIMAIEVFCYLTGHVTWTGCWLSSESRIYTDC